MRKYFFILFPFMMLVVFQCKKTPEGLSFKSPRIEAEYWYEKQDGYYAGSRQSQYYISKVLDADPTYARAWMRKALPHLQKGEFAKGFKYLDKAVELKPLEYLGYRGCAKLYYLHDGDGAIKDLMQLDTMTPNFTDAPWGKDIYYHLGIAHKVNNDLNKALSYFNFSIGNTTRERGEDWVDVKVFLYRGIVKLELGDWNGAISDFDKGIFYFDKFTEAYFYKGMALLKSGNDIPACKYFEKAKKHFEEGYTYSNQMHGMEEEVLEEDILAALFGCECIVEGTMIIGQ